MLEPSTEMGATAAVKVHHKKPLPQHGFAGFVGNEDQF